MSDTDDSSPERMEKPAPKPARLGLPRRPAGAVGEQNGAPTTSRRAAEMEANGEEARAAIITDNAQRPRARAGLPRATVCAPTPSGTPRPSAVASDGKLPSPPTSSHRPALGTSIASAPVSRASGSCQKAGEAKPSSTSRALQRVLLGVGLLVLAGVVIVAARWLVSLEFVKDFVTTYPGETELPENTPVGMPASVGWQHFFNAFLIVLMIKSGWQVRTQKRPPAMWTRNNSGLLRTTNQPLKISITLWLHLSLDALWFINGVIFVVVLFTSGRWVRVVPTSWEVFPNAVSAALQYASLDWPMENGWVNYNGLQVLAYFVTIFVAAPVAAITGIRMSAAWPRRATRLNVVYPVELARAVHLPVMLYFVLFIITHVALVFATGARRNLNHMYASRDVIDWVGFSIFGVSVLVMCGAWFAARPALIASIASLAGKVSR